MNLKKRFQSGRKNFLPIAVTGFPRRPDMEQLKDKIWKGDKLSEAVSDRSMQPSLYVLHAGAGIAICSKADTS